MPDDDSNVREAILADPVLGAVRRRHPDVDVVLLPPEDDAAAPEPMGADELAALVARDERELELTLEDVALPVDQSPRWSSGTVRGTLVRRSVRARSGLTPTEAEDLVASLIVAFEEHGWRVDETAAGQSRCRATSAGDTVNVEVLHVVATGRVAVIADAGPYPVADDLAQALRRQQREAAS